MTDIPYRTALIVGAGSGISASVARGLAAAGLRVGLAARNVEKLAPLVAETRAQTFAVDATDPAAVARLFEDADTRLGEPDMVLYNASARAHGPIAELDPEAVRKAVEVSAYGGFLVVQQAVRRMIPPWPRRHSADWRQRQCEGIPTLCGLRDGQICLARSGAEHSARARAEGHPRRPFCDRRRRAQRAAARSCRPPGQHARS